MPLVRLEVRNVYGLGKTELHSNVEREDTKAILDGVAVSGLVGILRQLGDLTEFAAEIFHGIQEEVMITSSRSSKLKMRLKQIEATVPSIQKKVIAQTNHIHFAYTGGLEWHPRIPNVQNQFIYDDLPHFVMAPYEDCKDPPRLHLLDKFDVNGPGSCLKRYSDPTHFKSASRASKLPETKKKKSVQRNRDISSLASKANQSDRKASTCLSFSGRTSSSKSPSTIETETKPDIQDQHRSCSLDSRIGGEKKPKGVFTSSRTIASVLSETESEDGNDSLSQDPTPHGSCCVSWHEKAEIEEMDALQCAAEVAPQVTETTNSVADVLKEHIEVEAVQDIKLMGMEMDIESEGEGDDFVDAPYTIDSESENDQNNEEVQKKSSNEITEENLENSLREEQETEKISNNFSDDEIICAAATSDIRNGTHKYYSNGFSNPLYDTDGIQEHQESEDETSCDTEATKLWTNGNLLGVEAKIVAEVIPENDEETFQEPSREDYNKAYFDWFASSPQLDHMKISFNHSETLQSSELKLKLAEEDTFPSFQLVPETAAANPFPDSDSDKDTFCRSSSCISDNSDNHSVSISEQQWVEEEEEEEVEEIRESKIQEELYDSFHKVNPQASSLSAPSPQIETPSNGYLAKNLSFLQNPAEPLPPPLPPIQWMVSKIPSGRFEDNNKQSLQDTLIRELKQNNSLSTFKKQEPTNIVIASHPPKPDNNKNNVRDYKQSHCNKKETEAGDFLHQIRTKQFNLRRVVTTRTYVSEAAKNTNFSLILEKANSIRQAVASDDGDGESETWSDSDA